MACHGECRSVLRIAKPVSLASRSVGMFVNSTPLPLGDDRSTDDADDVKSRAVLEQVPLRVDDATASAAAFV